MLDDLANPETNRAKVYFITTVEHGKKVAKGRLLVPTFQPLVHVMLTIAVDKGDGVGATTIVPVRQLNRVIKRSEAD